MTNDYLAHHGILGQKWGVRRFEDYDGHLTEAGKVRYDEKTERKLRTQEHIIGTSHKKKKIAKADRRTTLIKRNAKFKRNLKKAGAVAALAGTAALTGYLMKRNGVSPTDLANTAVGNIRRAAQSDKAKHVASTVKEAGNRVSRMAKNTASAALSKGKDKITDYGSSYIAKRIIGDADPDNPFTWGEMVGNAKDLIDDGKLIYSGLKVVKNISMGKASSMLNQDTIRRISEQVLSPYGITS